MPDAEESRELWNGIRGRSVKHNENAEWLKDLERDLNTIEKQDNVKITAASQKKNLRKWLVGNRQALMACIDIG